MVDEQLQIDILPGDRGTVVALRGLATISHAEKLRAALKPVIHKDQRRVVLDLTKLEFINSDGLGALLEFRRNLTAVGGQLSLCGVTGQIAEVLRKTRLFQVFLIYDNPELALGA